ncbi:MAG TPA: hypothetical protein VJK08_03330, partial [Patescibacteria group bacterium]|nr:hypothetical protein [Patescibacteria group bacterium]
MGENFADKRCQTKNSRRDTMRRSLFVTVLIVVIAGLMASGLIGCGGGGKDDGGTEDGGVNGSTARVHVVIVTTGGTIEDLVNPTFGLTTTASVQPAMIQGFTQRLVADTPHGKVASFDITLRRTTSFNVHGLVGYCPIVFEDRNGD